MKLSRAVPGRKRARPTKRQLRIVILLKHPKAWGLPPGGSTEQIWCSIHVSARIACSLPSGILEALRESQSGWRGILGPFEERMPSQMDGCSGHAGCWKASHLVRSAPGLRRGKDLFVCSKKAIRCGRLLSRWKGFASRRNAEALTLRCWAAQCKGSRWLRKATWQREWVTSTR